MTSNCVGVMGFSLYLFDSIYFNLTGGKTSWPFCNGSRLGDGLPSESFTISEDSHSSTISCGVESSFDSTVVPRIIDNNKPLITRFPFSNGLRVLVSRELIGGKYLYKFPGGGLQYGEGLIEGLQRESMEEMNQNLKNIKHFYTTDFFQQSQFDSKDQLIAIYYLVLQKKPAK